MARGFLQKYELDYDETFSPVVKITTMRTLIALCHALHKLALEACTTVRKTTVACTNECKMMAMCTRKCTRHQHSCAWAVGPSTRTRPHAHGQCYAHNWTRPCAQMDWVVHMNSAERENSLEHSRRHTKVLEGP